MHYCIAIITEQFPTDDVLMEKLEPFNEEKFYSQFDDEEEMPKNVVYPQFMWDWWQVGGRYNGLLKLKIEKDNEEYGWEFYSKEPRAGRLYRSKLFEECFNKVRSDGTRLLLGSEEDFYGYLGYQDGYIRVDGCKIKDVIDFEQTILNHGWGFIGKDGTVYSRSYWNGRNYIVDEKYEEKVRNAIKNIDDCYVCYVDIHD